MWLPSGLAVPGCVVQAAVKTGEAGWHREGLLMSPISVGSSAQDRETADQQFL